MASYDEDAERLDSMHDLPFDVLEDDDEAPATSTTCGEWFISLSAMTRYIVVFVVVGGLAGLVTGLLIVLRPASSRPEPSEMRPIVINTWFAVANMEAARRLQSGYTALDAVELGCAACEIAQCGGTVGWGGGEDTTGSVTLDAIIMDGDSHETGSVTYLSSTRHAIAAARKVMYYSSHTVLAGAGADSFAHAMGIAVEPLNSTASDADYRTWRAGGCKPNFYAHVDGGVGGCPPFAPLPTPAYTPAYTSTPVAGSASTRLVPAVALPQRRTRSGAAVAASDAVAMCAIDAGGRIAAGGSSNGLRHKIAGRSSDIALPGAGVYADRDGGCAVVTGDGDVTARFLPAFLAVEFMRVGIDPSAACERTVRRIMVSYANFSIGIVCLDRNGRVGAASHGWPGSNFTYAVAAGATGNTTMFTVAPLL